RDGGAVLAADARALELGRQHLRVVDHQHVAGVEQVEQVRDMAVEQRLAGPHDEHAGTVARPGRMQCRPLLGALEIEEIDPHQDPQLTAQAPIPGMRRVPAETASSPSLALNSLSSAITAASLSRASMRTLC